MNTELNTMFIAGIRFERVGKIYHFSCEIQDLKIGDNVVVETSRGCQIGRVVQVNVVTNQVNINNLKKIDRRATQEDLSHRESLREKELSVLELCRQKSDEFHFEGVKFVEAEFSFDENRLTIVYNQEADEKLDLKPLRRVLQKNYPSSQLELRQIGPRDVAKSICGIGACGLERRCCCSFLTEFSSISIRMAKEQGISLSPSEITGICGRLRCCLNYEYETYVEARKILPKKNRIILTPQGEGKVIDNYPLKNSVLVFIPEVGNREFTLEELQAMDGSKEIPDEIVAESPLVQVNELPSPSDKKRIRRKRRRRPASKKDK